MRWAKGTVAFSFTVRGGVFVIYNEAELKKHIKTKDFQPVYLIYGDENYLKLHYAELLSSSIVNKAFESLDLDRFDGKSVDLRCVFDRALILPMFSSRRCVVVEDFKLEGLSEKDAKLLEASIPKLGADSVVIFLQTTDSFTDKNGKKAASIIGKYGAVCKLDKRKGSELIKPLLSSASKQGCALSSSVAQYLVACVGDDFNVLINELSKVCNYVGSGEIKKSDIDAVAVKTVDARVSSLTRALIGGNFEKAYDVLNSLVTQRVEPNYILGSIIGTYVDMYRAKVAAQSVGGTKSLSTLFNYKGREFALNYAARDGAKIELSRLRACLDELARADMALKGFGTSGTLVIEQLMVKLLLIANGERI